MLLGERSVLRRGSLTDHGNREAVGERRLPAGELGKELLARSAARCDEDQDERSIPGRAATRASEFFREGQGEQSRAPWRRPAARAGGRRAAPVRPRGPPASAAARATAAGRPHPAARATATARRRPARPECGPRPRRGSTGRGLARRRPPRGRRARRCGPVPHAPLGPSEAGRSSDSPGPARAGSALAIPPMKPSSSTSAASAPQRAEPGGIRATAVASSSSGSSRAATGSDRAGNAELGKRTTRSRPVEELGGARDGEHRRQHDPDAEHERAHGGHPTDRIARVAWHMITAMAEQATGPDEQRSRKRQAVPDEHELAFEAFGVRAALSANRPELVERLRPLLPPGWRALPGVGGRAAGSP